MKAHHFKGLGVALVTPFKNGAIDFPALERVIEHVIAGGTDYLVSLGTTGESVTLSHNECLEVLTFTSDVAAGRLPIVAGIFGHNNTRGLVDKIKAFDFSKVDGILSSSPAYNKPPQEGIYQHYMAIAKVSPVPIIIYNVPGRTSSNITAETTLRLAHASKKFVAIKEASGDLTQGSQIIKEKPDHFLVLSGDDPTAYPLMACGADGVISVIGNALPSDFSKMVHAALAGDMATAEKFHLKLLDLHPWLYIDGNPAGIKATLELMGLCNKEVRLPLVPQQTINIAGLRAELKKIGLLKNRVNI